MANPTIPIAFLAGLISFVSPCNLPIIPGFLAYLSGTSVNDRSPQARVHTFLNSVAFVLGFSSIFALVGVLLNRALGATAYALQVWLSRLGGLVIIFFALSIMGVIRIPWLQAEHKLRVKHRFRFDYVTSFVFGAAFAVGWSPCVGAVLGTILALALTQPASSFVLLMSYALGLGIPFLLVGLFTQEAAALIRRSGKLLKYFNLVVGMLLLVLGVLVFTGNLAKVAYLFPVRGLFG